MQLFEALPMAVALLMVDVTPPASDRKQHKMVFRVGVGDRERRLTTAMLPRDPAERRDAWRAWLTRGMPEGSHESRAWCESRDLPCGRHLLAVHKAPLAGCTVEARPGDAPELANERRPGVSNEHANALFPPPVLGVVEQFQEIRAELDRMVAASEGAILRQRDATLAKGVRARLVPSSAARFVDGGYAELHYVRSCPSEHSTAYELELWPSDDADEQAGACTEEASSREQDGGEHSELD